MSLGSNGVDWVRSLRKIPMRLYDTTCALIAPVQPILHQVSCSNETLTKAPKHYETHQNISLGSNEVERVRSLRKIPKRLRGTNSCTSSERLASSSIRQLNNPKCTQMVRNAPKHEFRVQWGGSGAFVARNSEVTSCLHQFGPFCLEFFWQPNGPKCIQIVRNAPKHQFSVL